MRVFVLGVAMAVGACSPAVPDNEMAGNGGGAGRSGSNQSDGLAPSPAPVARATSTPTPIAAPTDAAAQTDAGNESVAAKAVVDRYYAAIAAGRYRDAWVLWRRQGAASGMTADAFATSFDRYASYDVTVGAPFDADAGAGQRYISVPVTIRGRLKSGGPFMLEGPLHLHKVAEAIESDDPHAHEWRIDTSAIRPRPDLAG